MSELLSVGTIKEAHQAWLEMTSASKQPYPMGSGTGTPDPLPAFSVRLIGELAQIRGINAADRQITAGCGATIAALEIELNSMGLCFPARVFDPAKITLGGWLGAGMPGAGGRILPGRRLLAATMITPQGRLIHSGSATPKDVAGYDFHRPLVGAWGKLGMLLEVTLAVDAQPASSQLLRLKPDNMALLLEQADRCKTVARLWANNDPDDRTEIIVELCGDSDSVNLDSGILGTNANCYEILAEEAGEFWRKLLSDKFNKDGYYTRWTLPTAQACTVLVAGELWGNPWEGRIWRYLGRVKPVGDLPVGHIIFKRKDEKFYPLNIANPATSNIYITNAWYTKTI